MIKRLTRWMVTVLGAAALVACGGGGGGGSLYGGGAASAPGTSTPTAADITLQLDKTTVNNAGSDTVAVTLTAVDSSRNVLSGIPVRISVDNEAIAAVGGSATDAKGQVKATVSIGANRANRLITVTAVSGSLQRTAAFQVTGARLTATALPAVVAPNSPNNKIQYRLVDVNDSPMVGLSVIVTANGLADVTGTTDGNGSFDYIYTAPATTGPLAFTAKAGGANAPATSVLIQAGPGAKPDAVGPILSASVRANPSVVSVNTDTTDNRAELRALFLRVSNAPVENVRVRFELPDPNSIGGSITTASTTVYSDVNGVAVSAYRPASRSSPTNGVVVDVCYDVTDFAVGACPNRTSTTLTVISEPLAVSIGTDNTIQDGPSGLTYIKRFVVLVVDSSGQAKADVQLTPSVDLNSYIKGYFDGPGGWNRASPSASNPVPVPGSIGFTGSTCANEDLNRNGVLEAGEDINNNNQLDPRKSDVAITFIGTSRTNASGTAVLQIEYPKSVATWINYTILVSASGVSGTEGRTTYTGQLPAAAAEFTSTTPPSFVVGPYGLGRTDSNRDLTIDCKDKD